MSDFAFYLLLFVWVFVALVVFGILLRIAAPYGRHRDSGWGFEINHRLAWFLMELPALVVFPVVLVWVSRQLSAPLVVFLVLWEIHYLNRTVIFPLRMSAGKRTMPIVIVASAIFFNTVNGFLNGYYLGALAPSYGSEWFTDVRFVAGAAIFALGLAVNVSSDNRLLRIRKDSGGGYRVPEGGLFRFVSSPNYLGEIIEWIGYALLTWSPAAATFAVWTAANLVPRALSNHRWYRSRFPQYPDDRKALVPFLL